MSSKLLTALTMSPLNLTKSSMFFARSTNPISSNCFNFCSNGVAALAGSSCFPIGTGAGDAGALGVTGVGVMTGITTGVATGDAGVETGIGVGAGVDSG